MLIEMAPHRVDAVLIDVQVGGTDGAPLAREVRERWPRLAVKTARCCASRCLAKPVARDELFLRLREALGRSPARAEGKDGESPAGPCEQVPLERRR